ncbi:MAG: ACT domain-containing protein [Clostridia bacterium]|nr:ACT domain-containing protein [Clostridia bacterium]
MNGDFLIIHKEVLPPFYEKVVEAVRLLEQENKSVSDVCKELDISRSTFYKYKDKVFELSSDFGRKAIISFRAQNEKGVLSNVINEISGYHGNILTINQDMPIHSLAYITVMIDTRDMTVSVYELVENIKKIQKVKDVTLVAFE